jgi:hypothetical protein
MGDYSFRPGVPSFLSMGALAFRPDGVLFIADSKAATLFAIDIRSDTVAGSQIGELVGLDAELASMFGVARQDIWIGGMAIHPISNAAYLSVRAGRGSYSLSALVRIGAPGEIDEVELSELPFTQVGLDDAPHFDDDRQDVLLDGSDSGSEEVQVGDVSLSLARVPLRTSTITDLAWADGAVVVAGMSNEEFSSTLRRVPFPFRSDISSTALEIYHVSHGRYETASPIRTFIPFDGNSRVLASYTCTPLVSFTMAELQSGGKVTGRTVAELGAMNQPLDMVSYEQSGEEYLLVSNTRHPLLKIPAGPIAEQEPLTHPKEPIGVPRRELEIAGVTLMASVDRSHVLMLQREDAGGLAIRSYSEDSL